MNAYRWNVGLRTWRWVSSPNPPWNSEVGMFSSSNTSQKVQYENESTRSPPPASTGAR